MATTLHNNLLAYYFSSQLPDLRWETDSEALTVSLYCPDGGNILEVTLTPTANVVKLWEVREAVERRMRHLNRSHIPLFVRWREAGEQTFSQANVIHVYYCNLNIFTSCSEWMTTHFLTTLESKPLPAPGATENLFFVHPVPVAVTPELLATCRLSTGEVRVIELENYFNEIPANGTIVRQVLWSLNNVTTAAMEAEGTVEEVIGVTIRVESRVMTYYKPAIPADQAFVFANAFGVKETAWLNCVTVTKTKDARKVASVARRAMLYDFDQSVTHEVETSPLPLEVAHWLAQLVTSPWTWLGNGEPIIITDGDASISDDAAVMNNIKFTWQYDDARDVMTIDGTDINIFQQPPFSHQFD